MDKIPPLALLLHSFPEAALVGALSLIFVNLKPRMPKAVLFGALSACTSYLVRQFPWRVGTHLIVVTVINAILLSRIYDLSLKKALFGFVPALTVLVLAEQFFALQILTNTTLTYEIIMAPENGLLRVLVAMPQMLFLALLVFAGFRYRRLEPGGYVYVRNHRKYR